jgi:DNA repair protein RecO (recombination protein O)
MIEQNAFVLHARPYRENQKLVDLLTEDDGKVTALVYVGQSKRSIKKGLIQPFLPLRVIFKDQGRFKLIKEIDTTGKSLTLVKHSLFSAFYINELLIRLMTEQIACQELFSQYKLTISALAKGEDIASQLRQFEQSLLAELGLSFDFTPTFEHNVRYFYYIAEQGFVPVYGALPKNRAQCFDKAHLQEIAQLDMLHQSPISPAVANTFKLLMRQVINQLLGNKPLNSRKLFMNKV